MDARLGGLRDLSNYKRDPNEDFYGLLGCDRTSSLEQITTEYKIRAKELHPDKCTDDNAVENFKRLQMAKEVLCNPDERVKYNKWLDSGLAISYRNWRGMGDAMHTSMHWATPRTMGRMLGIDPAADEPLSLRTSPLKEEADDNDETDKFPGDEEQDEASEKAEDQGEDDISYDPTPYDKLGFTVATPPPEFGWDRPKEEREKEAMKQFEREDEQLKKPRVTEAVLQKRQQFAQRRDSSIGTAMVVDPIDDEEMRRRFRNYEL